ncbi:MAG: hypothetical protein WAP53_00280 [Dysgonamonadaceae bacterium]
MTPSKCKTNPTFSAPSSYQGRTILAPCLHQPCTKYARQSGSLCSEHAGFTHHQPAESGAALPALKRTKSEGRANKERRNASETCKNQHYLSYHPQAFSVDP